VTSKKPIRNVYLHLSYFKTLKRKKKAFSLPPLNLGYVLCLPQTNAYGFFAVILSPLILGEKRPGHFSRVGIQKKNLLGTIIFTGVPYGRLIVI
jgi:hypothetical protein